MNQTPDPLVPAKQLNMTTISNGTEAPMSVEIILAPGEAVKIPAAYDVHMTAVAYTD